MGKQTFLEWLREWIGGIGFDVFLWSVRMTPDEYFEALIRESTPTHCEHGYNGLCPTCDAMNIVHEGKKRMEVV